MKYNELEKMILDSQDNLDKLCDAIRIMREENTDCKKAIASPITFDCNMGCDGIGIIKNNKSLSYHNVYGYQVNLFNEKQEVKCCITCEPVTELKIGHTYYIASNLHVSSISDVSNYYKYIKSDTVAGHIENISLKM